MLRIATCQFPISANIKRNCDFMVRQIDQSAQRGAKIVHFGECALSGYCGVDFKTWSGFNWGLLQTSFERLQWVAEQHQVWLVFGSSHRLTGEHLPHNSVYVVDSSGVLITRYDKRRCSVKDLNHYTPGTTPITFQVEEITFGILICLDYRFPELYREYMDMGVACVLHSFHDARKQGSSLSSVIVQPTLQGHAGNTAMWISVANNSASYQSFSSSWIDPSGSAKARAKRHRTDVIVNELDMAHHGAYITMVRSFRADARSGNIYAPKIAPDARSDNRTQF